jgi:hypothetical protein
MDKAFLIIAIMVIVVVLLFAGSWLIMAVWNSVIIGQMGIGVGKISMWGALGIWVVLGLIFNRSSSD